MSETQAIKIARMEEKIDNLTESVKDIKDTLLRHVDAEEKKFNSLSKKYAPKWVEKAVTWTIALIISGVVGALLKLVIV